MRIFCCIITVLPLNKHWRHKTCQVHVFFSLNLFKPCLLIVSPYISSCFLNTFYSHSSVSDLGLSVPTLSIYLLIKVYIGEGRFYMFRTRYLSLRHSEERKKFDFQRNFSLSTDLRFLFFSPYLSIYSVC